MVSSSGYYVWPRHAELVLHRSDEFKKWIEGYGIEHRQAGGDPAALMKLSVEHTVSQRISWE